MFTRACTSRRQFLKTSMIAGAAALGPARWARGAVAATPSAATPLAAAAPPARVALTTGDSRADIAFRALRPLADDIARAIGNRRVIVKPNNVSVTRQLAATHAETLEGILEFLKSIGKLENAIIAESAAEGPTMTGFEAFRYGPVAAKYGVKLVDLDAEEVQIVHVLDERDMRPKPVRMSKMLMDPGSFILSAARMKTHTLVVATLSLKNIILGAPLKDLAAGEGRRVRSDKPIMHGGGVYGINYNLFAMAQRLHPHLALIDGFDGMEGNGPTQGTPVEHRVCVAGLDWLAADRVALELMGIDMAKVGYMTYAAEAGLGQADLKKIEVIGESIEKHRRVYRLSDRIERQLQWMNPPQRT